VRRVLVIVGAMAVVAIGVSGAVAVGAGSVRHASTTTTPTTDDHEGVKVSVCHHTGSWKHPYHLIRISSHALPAHRRHGDVDPGSGNSCPSAQPAGAAARGHGNPGTHGNTSKGKEDDADDNDADDNDPGD
jgi:hypothetical protein